MLEEEILTYRPLRFSKVAFRGLYFLVGGNFGFLLLTSGIKIQLMYGFGTSIQI
jgi:hypothetical protein